ncbi:MAG: phosphatidylinositol diacylglycerol-lyase, partial [Clostridia bacterium]|nr:phosphatidylinositol diacylglycerol-lyase [Clostridia bacterium]
MKKISSRILAIVLAALLIFTSAVPISAQSFSTNSLLTTAVSGNNWMSGIKDDTAISDISMPGTHDSGTQNVDLPIWSKTQSLSISEQLNIGVRYFDLRLEHVS